MNDNNRPQNDESGIKRYTPEELQKKQREAKRAAQAKARAFKNKYLEFYDDIKQPENPSW